MIRHAYSNLVPDGTATSVVRPRDWNSAHVHELSLAGHVVGDSAFSANNVVLAGGPNVTLSGIVAGALATVLFSGANPSNAIEFVNSNGLVFGTNGSQVTASYTVPNQSQQPVFLSANNGSSSVATIRLANSNGVSFGVGTQGLTASVRTDYAGTDITSGALPLAQSTKFQQISNTSAITAQAFPSSHSSLLQPASDSTLFQQASGMSAYRATSQNSLLQFTSATSAITSNAAPLSQSTLFQRVSATSAITSNAIHSSQSSLFTGGLPAGQSTLFQQVSDSYLFQQTSGMSAYHRTSQNSLFQYTSATSAITSNAAPISQTSLFQRVSATSAITSNAIHSSVSSLFTGGGGIATSISSLFQLTSATSAITSNAIHSSNSSLFTGGFAGSSLLALSQHDHGGFQLNLTNLSGSLTTESNGLTVNLSANPPGGISVLAGTTGFNTGVLSFQDGVGHTYGLDSQSHLTISASSLQFLNDNNVSFTVSGGQLKASASFATTIVADSVRVWASGGYGTSTTINATALKFYDANNVSFGMNSLGEITAQAQAYPITLSLLGSVFDSLSFNLTNGFRLGNLPAATNYVPVQWTTYNHMYGSAIGAYVTGVDPTPFRANNMPGTLYGDSWLRDLSIYGANGIGVETAWFNSAPSIGSLSINGASLVRTDFSLALTNISATKSEQSGQITLSLSAGGAAQYSMSSSANGFAFTTFTANSLVSISDYLAVRNIDINGSNICVTNNNLVSLCVSGNMTASVSSPNAPVATLSVPYPTLSLVNLSGAVSTQIGGGYVIRLTGNTGGAGGGGGGLGFYAYTDSTNGHDATTFANPVMLGYRQTGMEWNEVVVEAYDDAGTGIFQLYQQQGNVNRIAVHTEQASTYRNLSETIFSNRPIMVSLPSDDFRRLNPNQCAAPTFDHHIRLFLSGAASSNRSLVGTVRVGMYVESVNSDGNNVWSRYASASDSFNYTASSQSSLWNGPMLLQMSGLSASDWLNNYANPVALLMFSPNSANQTWFNLPIYGAPSIASVNRIYSNGATAALNSSQSIAAYEGVYTTTTAALPASFSTQDFMASASQHLLRPWFELFDPSALVQ